MYAQALTDISSRRFTADVVADEVGPHIKRFECAWHVKQVAQSIKGLLGRYANGPAMIDAFIALIYGQEGSKEEFDAAFTALRATYPGLPAFAWEYVALL